MEADVKIYLEEIPLTDGSKVYNVILGDNTFNCFDEDHASDLVVGLTKLLVDHTNVKRIEIKEIMA